MLINLLIALFTTAAMEGVALLTHRYVMHGFGWVWHASHHRPRTGWFEWNDLFAVVFAAVAVLLIWWGTQGTWPLQWVGLGMTIYGLLYFVAHDGLVHRRWPLHLRPTQGYVKRLVQAHRLHHAAEDRLGAVSFGFILAPSRKRLKQQAATLRRAGSYRPPHAINAPNEQAAAKDPALDDPQPAFLPPGRARHPGQ